MNKMDSTVSNTDNYNRAFSNNNPILHRFSGTTTYWPR